MLLSGTVGRLPAFTSVRVRSRVTWNLVFSTWSSRSARNFWIFASSCTPVALMAPLSLAAPTASL
jgi:hypothetical protein